MPCLNEEASIGIRVAKALAGLACTGLTAEVVVVDNGSTDTTAEVAEKAGARVIREPRRGFGHACLTGFAVARGKFLVMADLTVSDDFRHIGRLVAPLQADDADYVLAPRSSRRARVISWPRTHSGNPVFTGMRNRVFDVPSPDGHSGMRAFTRAAYLRMDLRREGMELAAQLVIAAARAELRTVEVPLASNSRGGAPTSHSARGGSRRSRFSLRLTPRHRFVLPGLTMILLGLLGQLVLLPGAPGVGFHHLDVRICVLLALLAILGWQAVMLGVLADVRDLAAGRAGVRASRDRWAVSVLRRWFSLERGPVVGAALFTTGLAIDAVVLVGWITNALGPLNEMRPALLAMTLMVVGAQTMFGSFVLRMLAADPTGVYQPAGRYTRTTTAVATAEPAASV
ncbi:glycosyltransferase family 2 protein [Frankia sp. Cppng1_Ct_nod]|uniref:glycosyltransferase family 2 protein n=1 Tax=Frankia sp. Cppng1_Ct_nod TaxID=2897162 RepID=UPI0013EF6AA3